MEKILITAFFAVMSGVCGLVIMFLSFAASWNGLVGLVFSTMTSASCFLVAWFFTGIIDRYWYAFSAAVALPTLALNSEILIENLNLGHIPVVIAIPLVFTVASSFAGGYLKHKRINEERAKGAGETTGSLY